jgi:hypothetical protein
MPLFQIKGVQDWLHEPAGVLGASVEQVSTELLLATWLLLPHMV